ncbi:phage tail family protein [Virgibacillus halodenitrificans]|uniref:phage tail family protein n=1 Tax=Virgibacillus halodenitrificans TaxID=1482 RepID=UPI001FB26085|nr:phage tail family protein [Virgibacillus halodenitrificans]MCJ0932544.1 phage tail family protein [Virgibacillus halodenitrificans]
MRRLTFENARGESIVFYLSPLVIESLTGIGEIDADLQSEKAPYQDGDTYIDTLLQPRFIDLEGVITRTDLETIKFYRKHILRVCNPKLGLGKITLELDGDVKEIYGTLDGSPVFPERGREVWQKFMITWKCPNPYWRNPNQTSQPLKAYVGNFTLPFTLPFELGMSGSRTTLYNEGDIPAPIRIDIQGPVTNPQIINRTTGEWLKINRSIAADEVLHINTTPGKKRVEVYRGNEVYPALGYMDHDSDWITLELGKNEIEHIADAGDRESLVAVTWNSMYVGI